MWKLVCELTWTTKSDQTLQKIPNFKPVLARLKSENQTLEPWPIVSNISTSPAVYQKDQTETTYTYEKTDLFHVLDFLFSEI